MALTIGDRVKYHHPHNPASAYTDREGIVIDMDTGGHFYVYVQLDGDTMPTCFNPSVILCAAHTDPYILEQAYEQDEAGLEEGIVICPKCGVVIVLPDVFTDTFIICDTCLHEWSITSLNDEPTIAGEVTGYDNGPTFW
jgi:hypothetical protein